MVDKLQGCLWRQKRSFVGVYNKSPWATIFGDHNKNSSIVVMDYGEVFGSPLQAMGKALTAMWHSCGECPIFMIKCQPRECAVYIDQHRSFFPAISRYSLKDNEKPPKYITYRDLINRRNNSPITNPVKSLGEKTLDAIFNNETITDAMVYRTFPQLDPKKSSFSSRQ